jgi:hypothetical protein
MPRSSLGAGKGFQLTETGHHMHLAKAELLVLHLKLIVKGLDESVGMVKDTGKLLGQIVA